MARVALVNPPSRESVKTPLLGFAYLVAALEARGHVICVLDAAAPNAPKDHARIAERLRAFAPDLVGVHVKTLGAQDAYALASSLHASLDAPLVAGGPHPTVRREEPLRFGFTYVLCGEADESLADLADAIDGTRPLRSVAGLTFRDRGIVRSTPRAGWKTDLDALADPLAAVGAFDHEAYGSTTPIPPAGLLSSRGCPAACTFCSNDVTGRRFRYHSAARVADEVRRLRDDYRRPAFAFLDDSFAVGRRRVRELGRALEEVGGTSWTCTAHPAHLDRDVLLTMKQAGCGGIDIGMESADPDRLRAIGKGVTVERVVSVLGAARELDMHVVVNLMVLWPGETRAELDAMLAFMDRAAPLAGGFNCRGVLVPHPGTPEYELHHERSGFTEWWIREAPLAYEPFPTTWSAEETRRAYASDVALERNFFRHDRAHLEHASEVLRAKADLTLRTITSWSAGATQRPKVLVPAAGAR